MRYLHMLIRLTSTQYFRNSKMEHIYSLQRMRDGEKLEKAIVLNRESKNFVTKELEIRIVGDATSVLQLTNAEGQGLLNGYGLVLDEEYVLKMNDQIDVFDDGEHHSFIYTFEHAQSKKRPLTPDISIDAEKRIKTSLEELTPNIGLKPIKFDGTWQTIDKKLLVYAPIKDDTTESKKVACFDLDGTLIKTKSGKTFPVSGSDWIFWHPSKIAEKIQSHANLGFKIVIFTNQMGIGKDVGKMSDFKEKLEKIQKMMNCRMHVYAAIKRDQFRKPCTGMFEYLIKQFGEIDMEESFYVGDAAGRPANKAMKIKKDHSWADRLFAINLGLKFYTPEEFFLRQNPLPYEMPELDPRNFVSKPYTFELPATLTPEIIIMVGGPGSGKSMFCKSHLESNGYVYVNRDTLGSAQKCMALLEESIKNKKSVVVDNLNRDKSFRKPIVDNAKNLNVPVRCFYINTSKYQAMHNNRFRELTDRTHAVVPDIIIHSFYKHFQEPELSEGFNEIVKIEFAPDFTSFSEQDKKLYTSFILEK